MIVIDVVLFILFTPLLIASIVFILGYIYVVVGLLFMLLNLAAEEIIGWVNAR
jgi:hypothetical protein